MTAGALPAALSGRRLQAMNSEVDLLCWAPRAARRLARAERWLRGFEARFSRFRPLSELSRLNANAGRPFAASPALFRLVSSALALAARSGGVFDPTVLRDLEAAGYDRSFELVRPRAARPRPRRQRAGWRGVRLDAAHRTITLPAGEGIDLGGVGKGWAVDRLAGILGAPCLVNAGGDIYAAGQPSDAAAWYVGVEDPLVPERDITVLALRDRGVATSSRLRRRWGASHHLIDTRTGLSSASDAVQVTAIAPSALLADFHAKVALLLGVAAGRRYLESEPGVEGLIVGVDGRIFATSGVSGYEVRR